jgi:hypothetical protein
VIFCEKPGYLVDRCFRRNWRDKIKKVKVFLKLAVSLKGVEVFFSANTLGAAYLYKFGKRALEHSAQMVSWDMRSSTGPISSASNQVLLS